MAPIPNRGVVAVTGAAGYLGGWVVASLLERGYRVRACVRNVADDTRAGFLKAMPAYASGRLTVHGADLDQEGCFDEIFKGCNGVAHVSHVSGYDDQDYIRRTCDHIIASVNGSGSVTRVVVTSSVAAVISEMDLQEIARRPVFYEDRFPDEMNPKRTPDRGQGYSMGKLVAERAFSDAAAANGGWDAINCCPGDNVGPVQSAHQRQGAWQHQIARMLEGTCTQSGVYRPWMTVDVRDCADAPCRAADQHRGMKNGERYIAWSTDKRRTSRNICAGHRPPAAGAQPRHPSPVTDPFLFPSRIWRAKASSAASGRSATCATTACARRRALRSAHSTTSDPRLRESLILAVAEVQVKTKAAFLELGIVHA